MANTIGIDRLSQGGPGSLLPLVLDAVGPQSESSVGQIVSTQPLGTQFSLRGRLQTGSPRQKSGSSRSTETSGKSKIRAGDCFQALVFTSGP